MRTFVSPARALFLALALCPAAANAQDVITTIAGGGAFTGPATSVSFGEPFAVAQDGQGNLYVAAVSLSQVLKVDTSGNISLFAGNGSQAFSGDNGPATSASLSVPQGLFVDSAGNVFIADTGNARIRKVDTTGTITTVAGNGTFGFSGDQGPAINASLRGPRGLVLDGVGNLFFADTRNNRIRRVDAATGIITTVAGNGTRGFSGDNGPATSASLSLPRAVTVDGSGNLFIADTDNFRVRRVDTSTQVITTVVGTGTAGFNGDNISATTANITRVFGLSVDRSGNLFIADRGNARIREVDNTSQHIITTVAGNGTEGFNGDSGAATSIELNFAMDVRVDGSGNLFVADTGNNRIRKVAAPITPNGIITTVAGGGVDGDGGPATSAILVTPVELAFDTSGNLYIGDADNNRIRQVAAINRVITTSSTITTVAGNGTATFSGDGAAATNAGLCFSQGVAVDSSGNIFIADSCNNRIRKIDTGGTITTVAGNGTPGYTGDNGPAGSAELNFPAWVVLDGSGNLFIADFSNNVIRKVAAPISLGSIITTVAGNFNLGGTFSGDGGPATSAGLNGPGGVAIDGVGNMFIADSFNNRIRRVDATTQMITTVAGNGTAGFSGDNGPATSASINVPNAVTVDRFGILIPDTNNNRVRRVDATSASSRRWPALVRPSFPAMVVRPTPPVWALPQGSS